MIGKYEKSEANKIRLNPPPAPLKICGTSLSRLLSNQNAKTTKPLLWRIPLLCNTLSQAFQVVRPKYTCRHLSRQISLTLQLSQYLEATWRLSGLHHSRTTVQSQATATRFWLLLVMASSERTRFYLHSMRMLVRRTHRSRTCCRRGLGTRRSNFNVWLVYEWEFQIGFFRHAPALASQLFSSCKPMSKLFNHIHIELPAKKWSLAQ